MESRPGRRRSTRRRICPRQRGLWLRRGAGTRFRSTLRRSQIRREATVSIYGGRIVGEPATGSDHRETKRLEKLSRAGPARESESRAVSQRRPVLRLEAHSEFSPDHHIGPPESKNKGLYDGGLRRRQPSKDRDFQQAVGFVRCSYRWVKIFRCERDAQAEHQGKSKSQ